MPRCSAFSLKSPAPARGTARRAMTAANAARTKRVFMGGSTPTMHHSFLPMETTAMAKLLVLYKHPQDPAHFSEHYFGTHVPLAKTLPGLRRFEVSAGPVATPQG